MPRFAAVLFLVLLLAGLSVATGAVPTKATLLVDNPTNSAALIDVWRYNGSFWEWAQVAQLEARHRTPISPVSAGQRFRARLQSGTQYYTVTLKGGPQDIWTLR